MKMKISLLFMLSSVLLIFAQRASQPHSSTYPKDVFRSPVDIPVYLAGNFAELRNNHFHGGIDIKTQQREGLNLYSVGDGYISRINVSPRGYGNAVYIDHPNGYTSVYAHMQSFAPEIESYVREQQYAQQSFAVELYPEANLLKVTKGQKIGLSGNSGGSGGPHLHFEIRHTETEEPINPFYFGYDIPDTSKPMINGLYLYALDGEVAGKSYRYKFPGGTHFKSPIYASGKVGVGIKTYDKHNGASNTNGVHQITVYANDEKIFTYTANRFSFDETRAINSLCDYDAKMKYNSWIYQCFVTDGNPLRMYDDLKNNGIIEMEAGKEYHIKIIVSDYAGNQNTASYKLIGKENSRSPKVAPMGSKKFYWNKENTWSNGNIELFFPEGTFYEDFDFICEDQGGKFYVGDYDFPVHTYYKIAIKPTDIPAIKQSKAVIKRQYKYRGAWRTEYIAGELINGVIHGEAKYFGVFSLDLDETPPSISRLDKNSTFTSSSGQMRFRISDAKLDIKSFDFYVDGEWKLGTYDKKYKSLKIDLNKENVGKGFHQLILKVTDENNNVATYTTTFNKTS